VGSVPIWVFGGTEDEDAAIALAAWARQQRILIALDVRKVQTTT
jgi:hypothetical protein